MRPLLVVAAALACLLSPAAADEEPVDDRWPWTAVGRVQLDGKGPCSGVLIEPRTVLTVGHCVARRRPWEGRAPKRLQVVLAQQAHEVTAVELAPASPFQPDGDLGPVGNDWALLTLAEDATPTPVPYEGVPGARRAFILDLPLFKVGYAAGTRRRDVACGIVEVSSSGTAFTFSCPGGAGRGRSGSALLVRLGDGYTVVGTQSAEIRGRFTTLGVAVNLPAP